MARLLEEVSPGTPVRDCDGNPLGEVRGVFGSGEGRLAEFVLVYWSGRDVEGLLPADDVAAVGDLGVELIGSAAAYQTLAAFDPSANPALHRL